jgi:TolB-like protein/DNA-binding winged helix-turn-helix (wHTH) protein/Tfp pilus assembly protein PilF
MSTSAPAHNNLQFGVFELDLKAGELRKQGTRIKLQDQPLRVLALLIEQAGTVVAKEELRQKIWPSDTFVDFDHGLHSAMTRLREALGDSAESPRYIETLPRRGYRFIAPVEEICRRSEAAWPVAAASHNLLPRLAVPLVVGILAGTSLLAIVLGFNLGDARRWLRRQSNPTIRSLAVLPLQNLSGDPTQDYFADGMTEELISHLAQLRDVRVVSRTSSMRYRATTKGLPQIAQELGVDAVIEGSVMRSGQRVRITAQLLDARNDEHLWGQSYERDLEDVMVLQEDMSRAIADEIQVKLRVPPSFQAHLPTTRPVNPDAYLAYLKGQYYWNKRSPQALRTAIVYFKQAVDIDQNYAKAFAGLANAYSSLCLVADIRPLEGFPQAKQAALRAVELDPTSAEAHASLAYVKLWFDWDWSRAETEFRYALDLEPGYATGHQWYAEYLRLMGRQDEAISEGKRALELDPLSLIINMESGLPFYVEQRSDEAISYFRKTLEMDSNFGLAHCVLGWAYEQQGKYPQAIAELREALQLDDSPPILASLGHVYAVSGQRRDARLVLDLLRTRAQRGYVGPNFFAIVYTGLNENDKALDSLNQAYADHHWGLVWLQTATFFDPLRSNPRYSDLLSRMRFPPR